MKRRTSTLPVRTYTYHCDAPTRNAVLVDQQMYLARLYRNQLVEIELKRRQRYRELTEPGDSGARAKMLEIEARLRELTQERKRAKRASAARAKMGEPVAPPRGSDAEMKEQSKLLRAELRAVREEVAAERARRTQDDPLVASAIRALREEARAAAREARRESGVFWGTYLLVEDAVEQARRSRTDPRFGRWDRAGRIGVQIQGGASVHDVMNARSEWLQIDPLPKDQWETRPGRRKARTTVRIRVGTDEHRRAIWACFPMHMHRPLPDDAVIKTASIKRTRVARRYVYELQIVLEARSRELAPRLPASAPAAAIHFGWRMRPEGLRVGMLVDELGGQRELLLPRSYFEWLGQSDSLRSIRSRALDDMRPLLVDLLLALPDRPLWMAEDLKTMAMWQSPERMAEFVRNWRRHRHKRTFPAPPHAPGVVRVVERSALRNVPPHTLPMPASPAGMPPRDEPRAESPLPLWSVRTGRVLSGMHRIAERDRTETDPHYTLQVLALELSAREEAFVLATSWATQDTHLMRWQTYGARNALRWRREQFRLLAAEFSGTYRLLVLEKFDMRLRPARLSRHGEQEAPGTAAERIERHRAGLSTLRLALAHRNPVVMLDPTAAGSTNCHVCGASQAFDRAVLHVSELIQTCTACGARWDPDVNAARVLLQRFRQQHLMTPARSLRDTHESVGGE